MVFRHKLVSRGDLPPQSVDIDDKAGPTSYCDMENGAWSRLGVLRNVIGEW